MKLGKSNVENKYKNTICEYLFLRHVTEENLFYYRKVVDFLWLLLLDDEDCADYQPIHKLEYRFEKLAMDSNEERFSELEERISVY